MCSLKCAVGSVQWAGCIVQCEVVSVQRIREIKNLLTNADSSTDTKKNLASKAKFAKKKTIFLRSNLTPFISKSFQI